MGFYSKISQFGPQDTASKIIGGFVTFMVIGIVISTTVLLIPEVKVETLKRIPFIVNEIRSQQAGAGTSYADLYVGFGVSKDKGLTHSYGSYNDKVVNEIFVAPGDPFYLYWNGAGDKESFDPEHYQNKNVYPAIYRDVDVSEIQKDWWVGCRGWSGKDSGKRTVDWKQGRLVKGTEQFLEWSGFKVDGEYTQNDTKIKAGPTTVISSRESVKNPSGGYPYSLDGLGTYEFSLTCNKFDNNRRTVNGQVFANMRKAYDKVQVHVTEGGKTFEELAAASNAEKEETIQEVIDAGNTDYLSQPPSNLRVSVSCGKVQFNWINQMAGVFPTFSENPDYKTDFQVVVSNDPYFGTYSQYIDKYFSNTKETFDQFTIPGPTTFWSQASTEQTRVDLTPSNFAGDAMPVPAFSQPTAVNLASTMGVGTQSGSKFLFGTFYWKVLATTKWGTSEWVDGESFRVKCSDPGEEPSTVSKEFTLAKSPMSGPTPENSKGPVATLEKFVGCGSDPYEIWINRSGFALSGANKPDGYQLFFNIKISTDPKFSTYATPENQNSTSRLIWRSDGRVLNRVNGDLDPDTPGDQTLPVVGETYYMQVDTTLQQDLGPKKFTWLDQEVTSFVVCADTQPADSVPDLDPTDTDRDREEITLTGGELSEEELNFIIENLDVIKLLIRLFREGLLKL